MNTAFCCLQSISQFYKISFILQIKIKQHKNMAKLLKSIILIFTILSLTSLIALYFYGQEKQIQISYQHQFNLFQAGYKKLLKSLNKKTQTILLAKDQDGIDSFINFYIKSTNGSHFIKKRLITQNSNIQHIIHPILAQIRTFIVNKFLNLKTENRTNLWILQIDESTKNIPVQAIKNLFNQYPNDRFVLILEEKNADFEEIKQITYKRPTQKQISKLFKSLNITGNTQSIILNYHKNNLQNVFSLLNANQPQTQFWAIFQDFSQNIQTLISNSTNQAKVTNLLQNLCEKGYYKQKSQIKGLSPLNSVIGYENGHYYWTQRQYVYVFSKISNQVCTQFEKYATNAQNAVQIIKQVQKSQDNPIQKQSSVKEQEKVQQKKEQKKSKKQKNS